MSFTWFPPDMHDTWNWGSSDQRILFLLVWEYFMWLFFIHLYFLQIPSGFSCVITEERLESGHSKPRSVECCSYICPSVSFSHLHTWSWNDHQLIGHHSNQGPSPSIAQFGQEANSSSGYSFPDLFLDAILSLNSSGISFDLRAWFFLWNANLSNLMFYWEVCAFPDNTHSISTG